MAELENLNFESLKRNGNTVNENMIYVCQRCSALYSSVGYFGEAVDKRNSGQAMSAASKIAGRHLQDFSLKKSNELGLPLSHEQNVEVIMGFFDEYYDVLLGGLLPQNTSFLSMIENDLKFCERLYINKKFTDRERELMYEELKRRLN